MKAFAYRRSFAVFFIFYAIFMFLLGSFYHKAAMRDKVVSQMPNMLGATFENGYRNFLIKYFTDSNQYYGALGHDPALVLFFLSVGIATPILVLILVSTAFRNPIDRSLLKSKILTTVLATNLAILLPLIIIYLPNMNILIPVDMREQSLKFIKLILLIPLYITATFFLTLMLASWFKRLYLVWFISILIWYILVFIAQTPVRFISLSSCLTLMFSSTLGDLAIFLVTTILYCCIFGWISMRNLSHLQVKR